ncbi:MAG: 2Fe-2S iron-sulfur cluster-binding protein [Thermodesulfobacteriota bacterium]
MMNQTIKLKIDETEVEVEKGRTILEAAQLAGMNIPTLCHDRRLIPFGACRLCVVQQKGKSELLPACFTPAKKGMEIITILQKSQNRESFSSSSSSSTIP